MVATVPPTYSKHVRMLMDYSGIRGVYLPEAPHEKLMCVQFCCFQNNFIFWDIEKFEKIIYIPMTFYSLGPTSHEVWGTYENFVFCFEKKITPPEVYITLLTL